MTVSGDGAGGELQVTVRWRGPAAVLTVGGEIDLVTAPELDEAVGGVLDGGPGLLVVDLREVDFLSSSGLQVLAGAHGRLDTGALRVVSTSTITTRPFTSTGLDEWIKLFPSVDQALAGVAGTGG
ncbi:STAS domain-containing protein [Amycolatopsis panacis]|uniref:Anti-sigma factor antagonist n=1 Tax=Amycolatopsis panacis TaxID=2340917 RepID=A0A419HS18_9PSEU|nr:STAS domain-containing protein [Amycolatopsis panacis]RJQ79353.1 anti-sigma factor antagonist [Amycolatopsis panacis]